MTAEQVQNNSLHLGAVSIASGCQLVSVASCASTNELALSAVRSGSCHQATWYVADEQTAGRGRQGRSWVSPPGNLYASLLLISPCATELTPELGFVTGVALFRAIRPVLPGAIALGLKWPNDLMSAHAKLSGMLLEATRLPAGQSAVVIGIGVNCCSHPEKLERRDGSAYVTTDLESLSPGAGDRSRLLARLSDSVAESLSVWNHGAGFPAIRRAWLDAAIGIGSSIRVALGDKTVEGMFETIDPTGRLVLKCADQTLAIDAGDVLLG